MICRLFGGISEKKSIKYEIDTSKVFYPFLEYDYFEFHILACLIKYFILITPFGPENRMRVAFSFNKDVGNYHYGKNHPMKPHRSAVANSLIELYGLTKYMDILETKVEEKDTYHPTDYKFSGFKFNDDCPYFHGIENFCMEYTSNSLTAASSLIDYDIAINWSGGMHHGKKMEPSGFCYKNDIVIAIQRLLKFFDRILYIDIDIHHGDAVEEAFGFNERVLTCSFHKYGDGFFPGTGNLLSNHFSPQLKNSQLKNEIFLNAKKPFKLDSKIKNVLNVPLRNGIDDWSYSYVFQPIVSQLMKKFDPNVIVLQCGADSLAEDRLGCFNLSVQGHGACVNYVKSFQKKMLVIGGGGYTLNNVARAWTYETSILLEREISYEIPNGPYSEYFVPSNSLFPDFKRRHDNENTKGYLDSIMGYIHNIIDYS